MREALDSLRARNSDLREANEHLVFATLLAEQLREVAEQAHKRQDEFLAMLAHELRNPLGSIRSGVRLLARIESADSTLPIVREAIQRQVEHMARLLEDLLDVSRLTQGKVILQRQPTAIRECIEQAVDVCRTLIDAKRQHLSLDMPVTPLYVDGDPVRLAQIISNLVHNAAKYTPEGGDISVYARRQLDTVVVRVKDEGIGISAEGLPHIFDLFRQDDRSLNRSEGGLGIGLTVVRRMVELHGGSVEARSAGPGRGSEFIVTLPWADHAVERATESVERATVPARILLIDDNQDANAMLALLLTYSGHEVATAFDGPAGLQLLEEACPQVVICDIGLPGMDGYEVAARVRGRDSTQKPMMIALTGYGTAADRERALAAGFDHHLVKPVDPEALLRLIATVPPPC